MANTLYYLYGYTFDLVVAVVGTLLFFRRNSRIRSNQNFAFGFMWFWFAVGCFLGFLYDLLSVYSIFFPFIQVLSDQTYILTGCCAIAFFDSIWRDAIDYRKTTVMAAIGSPFFYISVVTNIGQSEFYQDTTYLISLGLYVLVLAVLAIYYFTKLYLHAPRSLKSMARLGLIGGLLWTLGAAIPILLELEAVAPALEQFLSGCGQLVVIFVFAREPRLAYISPFHALRLTVIETDGGIPLFNHTWHSGENLVNEDLFSGMLQGVSVILKESLNRGHVKEIHLDEGVMLVQRSKQAGIACVLVTTKSARILRDALIRFNDRFYKEYSAFVTKVPDGDPFAGAEKLVTECFGFIPEYE